jgi:archaellum biogenesis protein FlaJ (TadC family)
LNICHLLCFLQEGRTRVEVTWVTAFLVNLALAFIVGYLARTKGRSFGGFFFLAFVLSFVVGILVLLAMPARGERPAQRKLAESRPTNNRTARLFVGWVAVAFALLILALMVWRQTFDGVFAFMLVALLAFGGFNLYRGYSVNP